MKNKNRLIISISSDIGFELAKDWLKKGHKVYGTFRTESEKNNELISLGATLNKCDLASKDSITQSIKYFKEINSWDVIVVASGTQNPIKKFIECDFDEWEESFMINLFSPLRFLQGLLKQQNDSTETKIILFSGGGVNGTVENYSAYTTAKISLIKVCELLADEIKNISISILGPGWVNTKIHKETTNAGSNAGNNLKKTEKVIQDNSFYPMKKVIQCCNWIIGSDKNLVNGRNFSSVYDPWESSEIKIISSDDNNFKLRRYGNDIFHKND